MCVHVRVPMLRECWIFFLYSQADTVTILYLVSVEIFIDMIILFNTIIRRKKLFFKLSIYSFMWLKQYLSIPK